jgi:hypothetical protein
MLSSNTLCSNRNASQNFAILTYELCSPVPGVPVTKMLGGRADMAAAAAAFARESLLNHLLKRLVSSVSSG